MIPVEEIEQELDGKLSKDEIEDALIELEKHSTIFKPRKGYVQRMWFKTLDNHINL